MTEDNFLWKTTYDSILSLITCWPIPPHRSHIRVNENKDNENENENESAEDQDYVNQFECILTIDGDCWCESYKDEAKARNGTMQSNKDKGGNSDKLIGMGIIEATKLVDSGGISYGTDPKHGDKLQFRIFINRVRFSHRNKRCESGVGGWEKMY